MKKFFTIIALFISVIAYGQKEYTQKNNSYSNRPVACTEVKIGGYTGDEDVLARTGLYIRAKGRFYSICTAYEFNLDDDFEAINLTDFINSNKEELGEKLGLIFTSDAKWLRRGKVRVYAVTPEEKAIMDEHERYVEEQQREKELKRQERINSLSNILD